MVQCLLWRSVALWLLLSPMALGTLNDLQEEYGEPERSCLAAGDSMRGSADRSSTTVIIGWRFWDSQQLVVKMAEIVMREMLGYDVKVYPPAYRTDEWYKDLNEGTFDVSLEQWYAPVTGADYIKYIVTERSVHHVSFLGYVGRSGLYTSQLAIERDPLAGYYKFYQNTTRAIEIGFVTYAQTRAREVAEGFPVCTTDFFDWCGTGQFEGFWASPDCYDDPDTCVETVHVSPWWESGNLEMLARMNNMRQIFAYLGSNAIRQAQIVERLALGQPTLFFYWEPDSFLLRSDVNGARIQFPDYYLGCDRTNNRNPNTGTMSCDLVEDPLQNFVAARLRTNAPEAYYFVSQLYITPDEINQVIRSTMADQGGLDLFDAACQFIQSNRQKFVDYAPNCITHPPDVVENGDIVFNTESLQCENATILQEATLTTCASQNLSSNADRTDTKITLVRRDWLSHELVTAVTEVLLRDYLGYRVETRINDVTETKEWGNDMINLNLYDIDMESWQVFEGSESYITYVDSGLVQLAGLTGFAGRSGVFVSNAALEKARFASYYRFYQNLTTATEKGLLLHDATTFATSACPQTWCGLGALNGFWAPTDCRSSPELCGQLIHKDTLLDTSYVEQLLEQNGVHLVVGYFGDNTQSIIRSYVDSGTLVPFYWWEPDAFMSQLDVSRLSFPDNFQGCNLPNTFNPNTGSISCDFPEVSPMKIFKASLLSSAPEAYYTIDLIQMQRDDLEAMMAQHTSVGGSMTTEALVCQWIADNTATVGLWAPECLRNPIAFQELTVDSTVFDPEQLLCGPVKQCPSNSILRFFSIFICEECGAGDVPDPQQKNCITCDPGEEENVNGSACVPCPMGRAKDVGEVACSDCEPGYYTDTTGESQCFFCTGATYQSEAGQTACRSCDDQYINSVALFLGAFDKSQCDCPIGSYLPVGGTTCISCPEGFRCPYTATHAEHFPAGEVVIAENNTLPDRYPLVESGYMTLPSDPLKVYICHDEEHCPGGDPGTCAAFRDNKKVACGECGDGAYESGSECKECQGADFVPIIIVSVVALLLAGLAVMFLNGNILMKSSNALLMTVLGGLIMTALQTLTVFKQMGINWMNPFEAIMEAMSVITFNMELVRVACVVGSERVRGYLMRQCVAPFAILLLLFLLRIKKYFIPKTKLQNEFINTTGTVFNIFFISIVVSALGPHVCYDHPGDAGRSVISDPSILCDYTGEHMSMVIIGCIATLVVPVPFLGLVIYGVLRYPFVVKRSIKSDDFLAAFRFLFVRFHPQVYWFAIIVAGRSLFICLIPVFLTIAASQVMAMSLVLCSYMIAQQTVRPWRAAIANFVDMCMGVGLVLLLTAISVLTNFENGKSAVRVAGVLAMLVVVIAPATIIVLMQYRAWAAARFEQFICHHKAGAGAQARLMKMLLVNRHGKNVFIDSDNLVELDGLFDIVKTKVRVLVVYLSRDTLTRPWCVGEICTSFECHKRIVTVQTGSWEMPEESKIDEMPDLIDKTGCNLQEQGISEEIVAKSLRRIVSDEVPTIYMDNSRIGGSKFLRVAQQLTEAALFKDFGKGPPAVKQVSSGSDGNLRQSSMPAKSASSAAKQMKAEQGCLVACADPADDEAVAAVSILLMKANDQVVALGVPSVVNVTDHASATNDPTVLEEALYATQASRAVVSILTRRSLEVFLQVSMIVVGMAASCTMIPVNTWDFNFPTATYYATQLPQLWPSLNALPVTEAEGHLKSFFKLITVFLATMGSDQVLNVNAASVVSRVPKDYDPAKQKSLTSIVRAIVVAAQAGTGKKLSTHEDTMTNELTTNKLIEDDSEMTFAWTRHF